MFTIKRKDLDAALKIVMKCTASKSYTVPALQCCKIDVLEDGILISATDLEIGATVCIPAMSGTSQIGTVLVNTRQLSSMISTARKEEEISLGVEGNVLRIRNARIKSAHAVEDYPKLPIMPEKGTVSYSLQEDFACALRFVVSAKSKESTRYPLIGLYFDFPRGRLVGTDGRRMHVAALGKPIKITPLILPHRIFSAVQADTLVIPDPTEKQKGTKGESIMVFLTFPNGIAFARTIEGTFPDYTAVVPEKCPTQIEVERELLLDGLKSLLPLVSSKAPSCRMIANGTVDLLVSNTESGAESSASAPCKIKGREATAEVNPYYLYDCLAGLQSELVHIYFQKPHQAILIEDPETQWFGLVMPLTKDTEEENNKKSKTQKE